MIDGAGQKDAGVSEEVGRGGSDMIIGRMLMTRQVRPKSPTRHRSRGSSSGVVNREMSQDIRIVQKSSITELKLRAILKRRRV